jgi:hypothetical protein
MTRAHTCVRLSPPVRSLQPRRAPRELACVSVGGALGCVAARSLISCWMNARPTSNIFPKRSLGEALNRVSGKRIIERLPIAGVGETIDNANTMLSTPADID